MNLNELLEKASKLGNKTLYGCRYHHGGFSDASCECDRVLQQWDLQECQKLLPQLVKIIQDMQEANSDLLSGYEELMQGEDI